MPFVEDFHFLFGWHFVFITQFRQKILRKQLRTVNVFPAFTDVLPEAEIRQRIYTIAQEHNLSYYDASYLELAHRYNLPLKTYDEDLESAYKNPL